MREKTGLPIGIVTATWGGTTFAAWTPRETLQTDFPERVRDFDAALLKAAENAKYELPQGSFNTPMDIYNAMISPLSPASFTGVLWYQGEQDAGMGPRYTKGLKALIAGWRAAFDEPDLPFFIVQLPAYGNGEFPALRLAQAAATREIANTALIVTIDLGERNEIHPQGKPEIGRRAALAALVLVHGENAHFAAPSPQKAGMRNGGVEIVFDPADGPLVSLDGQPVRAFEIAGDDGKWAPATAIISAHRVFIALETKEKPRRVRYAMQPFPGANLGTPDNLAVGPFDLEVEIQNTP